MGVAFQNALTFGILQKWRGATAILRTEPLPPSLKFKKSANYECEQRKDSVRTTREQRTNNARPAYEQRANYARPAYANSYEQRANYEREVTRELRGAPVCGSFVLVDITNESDPDLISDVDETIAAFEEREEKEKEKAAAAATGSGPALADASASGKAKKR